MKMTVKRLVFGVGYQDVAQCIHLGKKLNASLPLKTKSIAPYETDVPVKIGAAESLFKTNDQGKWKNSEIVSSNQIDTTLDIN